MARKTKKIEEKTSKSKVSVKEEKPNEVTETSKVSVKEEKPNEVTETSKVKNELFSIDIKKYNITNENVEKYIKESLEFYVENKEKLNKNKTLIEDFKNKLTTYNYVPKNMVIKFLNDLL